MPPQFALPSGLKVVAIGDTWVSFSPLSGETMVLNDESAAIIEVLSESPASIESVCATLAADLGESPQALMPRIAPHWSQLIESGLVIELPTTR